MWKRLGLSAALLLILGGGLTLIDEALPGESTAAAQNTNSSTTAGPNTNTRRRHRRVHRRRARRRGRRGNKNANI